MKQLLTAFLMSLAMLVPSHAEDAQDWQAMPIDELESQAGVLHPVALYILANRLFYAGEKQAAANWMYAGQLRYRFMIGARGEAAADDRILFSALSEQVGRPINEYIAGDPDEWITAMRWALDWDAATDNTVTSKTQHAELLQTTRKGLEDLIQRVDSSRDEIREQRTANGLENR